MSDAIASWGSYRRLIPFLRPYAPQLALVLAISLVSTLVGLAQPLITKLLIDTALLRRDMDALLLVTGALFGVTLIGFALNLVANTRYLRVSAAMLFDMRVALLRHLQTLSPRFYARFRLGDLMSRLNRDVGDVQRATADTLLSVLGNVLFLVGSVVMMLLLNWRLFAVGMLLVPACLWSFVRLQARLTAHTHAMRERSTDVASLFVETILGMRVVTALRAEAHETARFADRNHAFVAAMMGMQRASFLTGAVPGTILAAATASVMLYGGWMILHDRMTIGTLVAFMAYHTRVLGPMQALMGLAAALAAARVSLARLFELFDMPAEVREHADPLPLGPRGAGFRFEGVAMRHDRGMILDGVDLVIPRGAFCAILGASGAGKSTLADLMVRYLDPDAGRVTLDGRDLRDLRLSDLRGEAVLVDQSPYLFNDSIAANIAFARPQATHAEIAAAGSAAGLDELIARLPEGYATQTGERGLQLSAGERQRVALARALLRKPGILILDEPSAALDLATEQRIAAGLRAALPDATLIVITHKPALAALADMVVTLEGARLRELAPAHG